jgi:hypothetical protein
MENNLLDDDLLGQEHKINYPFYLLVIALLNIILTVLAYSGFYPQINRLESMAVVESEGSLALIQATYWVFLMLFVDLVQAFKKAIKEKGLLRWGVHSFFLFLGSIGVIFLLTILILIPRAFFIVIVFIITSVSKVNFESIVLSMPYLLFTIVFITGILFFYNRDLSRHNLNQ